VGAEIPLAVFRNLCPNCGGEIDSRRLDLRLPCRKCLSLPDEEILKRLGDSPSKSRIAELLREAGTLTERYERLARWEDRLEKLASLFSKATGYKPWGAQRLWARRAVMDRSFAMVAPTGSGKTTFGLVLAIYVALEEKGKVYLLFPSTLLVQQAHERLESFIGRLGVKLEVVSYHANLTKKQASEAKERIAKGEYQILITTSSFLARNFQLLENRRFHLIFVDDVDALLRRSKNVDRVLKLLGFPQEVIDEALMILELRSKLRRALRVGGKELEKIRNLLDSAQERLQKFLSRGKMGLLVVSGASIRARRTKRIKLFQELLGFQLGSRLEMSRNVADLYTHPKKDLMAEAAELAKRLGGGGLLFVPMHGGLPMAQELAKQLEKLGIKALVYGKARRRLLEAFKSGEVDVLVGVASSRSPLARGLDLPQRVRYAIFAGVPKIKISLEFREEFKPYRAVILLARLRDLLNQRERRQADNYIERLRRLSPLLSPQEKQAILEAMQAGKQLKGFLGKAQKLFSEVAQFLELVLSREEVRKALRENPHLSLVEENGQYFLVVPDAVAYIQASGRTSRLYAGGVSRGLSVVLIDDDVAMQGLMREVRWFAEDVEWKSLDEVDLEQLISEVDRDRELIAKILRGEASLQLKDPVKSCLLVVESPNKARTIARFFGKPSKRRIGSLTLYEVSTGDKVLGIVASGGHVFDLAIGVGLHGVLVNDGEITPVYAPITRCRRCGESYTEPRDICPKCGGKNFENKLDIIQQLRGVAGEVDIVYIGTDADSEGEKIGWDIAQALSPYTNQIRRIEFHEITRRAILEALNSPREIDMRLVGAQLVRRVEDRWIGFTLSQKLWRRFNRYELSAGRVQTPVLGWVIRRTEESRRSVMEHYEITLENGLKFIVKKPRQTRREIEEFTEKLKQSTFTVEVVEESSVEVKPPPPYTTDTMLREAHAALKIGVEAIMRLAQDLFETGLITYHRTDSTRVSHVGMAIAREYIQERFGEKLYKGRPWAIGEEGAHECIRPTRPLDVDRLKEMISLGTLRLAKRLTRQHFALYALIFRRFMASQMKPAKALKQKITIRNKELGIEETKEGYVELTEPGFTLIKPIRLTPKAEQGEIRVSEVRHWQAPTIRLYTQGELIEEMKRRGIGRPSTYARIVQTLFRRGYVKEVGGKYLVPTQRGVLVYNYLSERFNRYVSEETTRKLRETMDLVEAGQVDYLEALNELYQQILEIEAASEQNS